MEELDRLIGELTEAKVDAERFFNGGNKSAGSRVRKVLLDVHKSTKNLRKEISEFAKDL